jgi:arylsulfatase A-like enzyme
LKINPNGPHEFKTFSRRDFLNGICVSNRSSWYTGLMPSEHGNYGNSGWNLRKNVPDLGQWLSARGYDCLYGGKWHVTGRERSGSFQVFCHEHPLGEVMDDGLAQSAEALLAGRHGHVELYHLPSTIQHLKK